MNKLLTSIAIALSAVTAMAQTSAPAFPGAEGHARYTTTGGRGGNVYHVTNLNDSGTGSLRWALSQAGPRTIVFDVSGYIDLKSQLNVTSNTTIAGQTAPGDGITLRYYTLYFGSADNVIVRYIRCRRSQLVDVNDGADATWGRNKKNIIIDHCSFSWSIDEVASFYDNLNFTMQWCTVGEALANPGHSKGEHSYGGIWGGKNASFHHNFMCHQQNRMPRFNGARYGWTGGNTAEYTTPTMAEHVDFRNCVMYNWGNGSACYGGPGGGYINMVNNYYKAGPGTKNKTTVTQVTVSVEGNSDKNHPEYYGLCSRYYISGNYVTAAGSSAANYDWKGVKYDSGLTTISGERYMPDPNHMYGPSFPYTKYNSKDYVPVKLNEEDKAGDVTTHTAQAAYEKVLAYAGASFARDAVDARYMEEAKTGTTTYTGETSKVAGIVDKVNSPTASPSEANYNNHANFPDLKAETRAADYDTDKDGMPDWWEDLNGLNKNDASDAKKYTIDSEKKFYTNLEVYINSIVEHITKAQNADAEKTVEEYYPACKMDTAIETPEQSSAIKSVEYYSLNGSRLASPANGISIRKINYANGTSTTDKVIAQ